MAGRTRAQRARRRRHVVLALVAAVAVSLVVGLVATLTWIYLRLDGAKTPDGPIAQQTPTAAPGAVPGRPPRPSAQDASCPDVQLLSIPGTWESSPQLDPFAPTQFPIALLLNVTNPIRGAFDDARLQVYTVPYTATFKNPFAAREANDKTYDASREEGTAAAAKALRDMNERCPLTGYVIVGFSQGAVIAGDLASDIGNGRGPVDADLVLGVTAIADGRRQDGVGIDVGPNPPGQGAEITLAEVPMLNTFGITMTGPRPDGFGALADRVHEICAPGDLICSAPPEAFNIVNLPRTLEILAGGAGSPVHALYNTPQFWALDGKPATVWTADWARGVIEGAPRPPHR